MSAIWCSRRSSGMKASASRWAMPAVGSSSRSSRGSAKTMDARSTTRRVPVESSDVRWCRKRSSPNAPMTWSTAARFCFSDRRAQGSRKVVGRTATSCLTSSQSSRTSSTDSSGKSRQSWNERTIPIRWRSSGRYSARSIPSSHTVPRLGRDQTGYHIEGRRLARTVGADQADDSARLGAEAHVIDRTNPSEGHAEILDGEPGRAGRPGHDSTTPGTSGSAGRAGALPSPEPEAPVRATHPDRAVQTVL